MDLTHFGRIADISALPHSRIGRIADVSVLSNRVVFCSVFP